MKLADYLSPTARVVQEPNSNAVSKIKRRDHARKLFGSLEKAWVPSLKRIKVDAFMTLK